MNPKIVILMFDGIVDEVYSNNSGIEVEIVDLDAAKSSPGRAIDIKDEVTEGLRKLHVENYPIGNGEQ